MASTSYGTSYHQYPTHPNLTSHPGRVVRPQCTPTHSFRGFQPQSTVRDEHDRYNTVDMDVEMEQEEIPDRSVYRAGEERRALERSIPSDEYDERDFHAFSADAFAPVHHGDDQKSPTKRMAEDQDDDVWSAFRKRLSAQSSDPWDLHGNKSAEKQKRSANNAVQHQVQARPIEADDASVPPDSERLWGNWSGGRLRNTVAREKHWAGQHDRH
jgi:hypothetical protein